MLFYNNVGVLNMEKCQLIKHGDLRIFNSENYNWRMNMKTGFFVRWGKKFEDNPPYGLPEIADIEISEVCHGVNGVPCPFCYKSNTGVGSNMNLDTFKQVLDNLFFLRQYIVTTTDGTKIVFNPHDEIIIADNKKKIALDIVKGDTIIKDGEYIVSDVTMRKETTVSQIAFGIGDIDGNPDLKDIILHTRERGVVPNITINGEGLTDEWVQFFSENLGAIAVSVYDKEISYNAIKKLTDAGMSQVNIHLMLAQETEEKAYEIFKDSKNDPRLAKLNAIVLLSLKTKGRGKHFTKLPQDKFKKLVDFSLEEEIRLGFDSCSAFKFLKSVEESEHYESYKRASEPCESTCFSLYINVHGDFYPCSFTENTENWETGLSMGRGAVDFLKDVWFHPRTNQTRQEIIKTRDACKNCFYFDI